jgi:hypothetical protein
MRATRPPLKLPADLQALLARRFENKHRDWLAGTDADGQWPLAIPLGLPTEQAALRQVDAVRAWAGAWRDWRGAGELRWSERRWKVLGTQSLPEVLVLHGPEQVAMWIGEQERWGRAASRFDHIVALWPPLAARRQRLFSMLADYSDADFERLLGLLAWIATHPDSGLYPRQIPIGGIDSKWIETRKGLLSELVAAVRGAAAVGADFYSLCGLRRPPVQVRMRILDPALRACLGGLGDITAPVGELAGLALPASVILIVENLQTGLALKDLPGAVAFMALGYSVDLLAELPWIVPATSIYWGDIDTHGFAILHRARSILPRLSSVLMDEATLLQFRPLWTDEKLQHGPTALSGLTSDENRVYYALKQNRWGQNLRLEQERIAWDFAWTAISRAVQVATPDRATQLPSASSRRQSGES